MRSARVAQLSVEEVAAQLRQPDAPHLLDCREAEELAICAIAGARHIPMSELKQRIGELDPEAPLIVFCHHGVRSVQVAAYLLDQGFESVASMRGGIDAWSCAIDPSVRRY